MEVSILNDSQQNATLQIKQGNAFQIFKGVKIRDLLEKVAGNQAYQRFFCLWSGMAMLCAGFAYQTTHFMVLEPVYLCSDGSGSEYICDLNQACLNPDYFWASEINNSMYESCDLNCFAHQTIFYGKNLVKIIGVLVSLLVLFIGDKKGRKPALFLSFLILGIGILSSTFKDGSVFGLMGIGFIWVGISSLFLLILVCWTEISINKAKEFGIIWVLVNWKIGAVLSCIINEKIDDYSVNLGICYLMVLILVCFSNWVFESPAYFHRTRKMKELIENLGKMAERNKVDFKEVLVFIQEKCGLNQLSNMEKGKIETTNLVDLIKSAEKHDILNNHLFLKRRPIFLFLLKMGFLFSVDFTCRKLSVNWTHYIHFGNYTLKNVSLSESIIPFFDLFGYLICSILCVYLKPKNILLFMNYLLLVFNLLAVGCFLIGPFLAPTVSDFISMIFMLILKIESAVFFPVLIFEILTNISTHFRILKIGISYFFGMLFPFLFPFLTQNVWDTKIYGLAFSTSLIAISLIILKKEKYLKP